MWVLLNEGIDALLQHFAGAFGHFGQFVQGVDGAFIFEPFYQAGDAGGVVANAF